MKLTLREHELTLRPGEPVVMGILNIGLDSVADGRTFASVAEQVKRGLTLAEQGGG
jgi:dihydropteroate synthase